MKANFKIAFGKMICAGVGLLFAHHAAAVDSTSVEFAGGNHTQIFRAGLQWNWDKQWFQSNGTHVGGYWEASLAQWRGNRYRDMPGARQDITDIGLTPVWRFQSDSKSGLYAEAGIGVHLLSGLYDNNGRKFSTAFQFGDHIGIGYKWSNGVDIGLKIQHISNGGIKRPNTGVNFAVLKLGYSF